MRVKEIKLKDFKRFDDLTIKLGDNPGKIIALVGPNGCGKSSIFDAFESKMKDFRSYGQSPAASYYQKSLYLDGGQSNKGGFDRNNSVQISVDGGSISRTTFYIRTAYRFTSQINVDELKAQPDILSLQDEPMSTISLDSRLVSNYKRLIANYYSDVQKSNKSGQELLVDLIEEINVKLRAVIDVEISQLGNPMDNKGEFYFKKENTIDFPYTNLSSGEKEVVDIIIDLLLKTKVYKDTIFCIDEPELHINTAIQRKLLIEIEKIIPENCQLWICTHSIGFLRALQEQLRDKSQIIDFSFKNYFVGTQEIRPMVKSRANWQRVFSGALEDLTGLVSPKKIIYCEGRDLPGLNGRERGLDARVYNQIFSEKYSDTLFISSGGNTELDQRSEIALKILSKVFSDVEILLLKDRDFLSDSHATVHDREIYLRDHSHRHRVLTRFEIENYLFDKAVLKKFCEKRRIPFDEESYDILVTNIAEDAIKDRVIKIKEICTIDANTPNDLFKIQLSECITEDMPVYLELEACIFY